MIPFFRRKFEKKIISINNRFNFWYLLADFKHFGVTSVNKRGNQILVCPLGYTYSMHMSSNQGTWWRCNSGAISNPNGTSKRCQLRIRTQRIGGYEMIELLKLHSHPPINPLSAVWVTIWWWLCFRCFIHVVYCYYCHRNPVCLLSKKLCMQIIKRKLTEKKNY